MLSDIRLMPTPGELDKTTPCLILAHLLPCLKTRHYPQNLKYITYYTVIRGQPSHSHSQHVQKIWLNLDVVVEICKWTDI